MAIKPYMLDGKGHYVPSDSAKQQILAAKTFMTRTITLQDTNKFKVIVPNGCYEAVLQSNSQFTVYESANTYTEVVNSVSITYGTGMSGTTMSVPAFDKDFYVSGTANQVITILFPCLRAAKD